VLRSGVAAPIDRERRTGAPVPRSPAAHALALRTSCRVSRAQMSARSGRKRPADDGAGCCDDNPWFTSFTWRIEEFSKHADVVQLSRAFEAGLCTWKLRVSFDGPVENEDTQVTLELLALDGMWEPNVELTLTVVNQADANKWSSMSTYHSTLSCKQQGYHARLNVLNTALQCRHKIQVQPGSLGC